MLNNCGDLLIQTGHKPVNLRRAVIGQKGGVDDQVYICIVLKMQNPVNSSISKLITGCWIVTHPIEIYCNVGNPQLFYTSCTGVEAFLLGGEYLAWGDFKGRNSVPPPPPPQQRDFLYEMVSGRSLAIDQATVLN